jgi:HEAT repeat protein
MKNHRSWALAFCLAAPASALAAPADLTVDMSSFQLEPLVITAPRLKIKPAALIDPIINSTLLRLLSQRQDARPDSQASLDASIGNLNNLSTLEGFQLKTRYTELGFLLTEGLAGSSDMSITSELERTARMGTNVQIRAAALVALAYTKDSRYLGLFQQALNDSNVSVRLSALESLSILASPGTQFSIADASRMDRSLAVQAYAAGTSWRSGDVYGRETLLRLAQNDDWFIRSLAIRFIGEMGGADEYRKLLAWLPMESHQVARAELCSALLNLQKKPGVQP